MRLNSLFNYLKPPRGFKLTKAGKIFFGFLFCLILIAMATGNNLLYLMLAGMLAFMIVSGIESELNLRYLELDRILPAEIYAGLPAKIEYLIRNPKNRSSRLILNDLAPVRVEQLPQQETEAINTNFTFSKRGYSHLGRITISTTYPYGLFEKSISFPFDEEIIVFPEPLTYTPLFTSGTQDTGVGIARDSVSHVRAYAPGEPLSSIAWKKQNHGLVSKVFEGGAGVGGILVLMPGPEMEKKLSRATYLISELHRSGRPFGLVLNGNYSGIALSRTHKIHILEQLALVKEIRQPGFDMISSDAQIIHI
jgi:uncharacterized protein (DUF58 family)